MTAPVSEDVERIAKLVHDARQMAIYNLIAHPWDHIPEDTREVTRAMARAILRDHKLAKTGAKK